MKIVGTQAVAKAVWREKKAVSADVTAKKRTKNERSTHT